VDPRAVVDDMEEFKILPYRDSNFDPPVVQPVTSGYTDYAVVALSVNCIKKVKLSL
jgi:hypothetical protein